MSGFSTSKAGHPSPQKFDLTKGKYISLLRLVDFDPLLRVPSIVAIVISSVLLAGGYCLNVLLRTVFQSWQLRQDLILPYAPNPFLNASAASSTPSFSNFSFVAHNDTQQPHVNAYNHSYNPRHDLTARQQQHTGPGGSYGYTYDPSEEELDATPQQMLSLLSRNRDRDRSLCRKRFEHV